MLAVKHVLLQSVLICSRDGSDNAAEAKSRSRRRRRRKKKNAGKQI